MTELKPCSFCGGRNLVELYSDDEGEALTEELMDATFRPLERKYAIHLLMEIYYNPGMHKTWYTDRSGMKNSRTMYKRLNDLGKMGLVSFDNEPRVNNTVYVELTPEGEKLAKVLDVLYQTIPHRECFPEEY